MQRGRCGISAGTWGLRGNGEVYRAEAVRMAESCGQAELWLKCLAVPMVGTSLHGVLRLRRPFASLRPYYAQNDSGLRQIWKSQCMIDGMPMWDERSRISSEFGILWGEYGKLEEGIGAGCNRRGDVFFYD